MRWNEMFKKNKKINHHLNLFSKKSFCFKKKRKTKNEQKCNFLRQFFCLIFFLEMLHPLGR